MKLVLIVMSLIATSAFASDGAGDGTINQGALDFAGNPAQRVAGPANPGRTGELAADYDRGVDSRAGEFVRQDRATKMTCAQAQSKSPYAFNGTCGRGYMAVRAYVRTTDVKNCYVGFDCVIVDSSSNH